MHGHPTKFGERRDDARPISGRQRVSKAFDFQPVSRDDEPEDREDDPPDQPPDEREDEDGEAPSRMMPEPVQLPDATHCEERLPL